MTKKHLWLLAAAACAWSIAGCGDSGRRVFEKAQDLFRSGQYDLALKHYRLVAEAHPKSEFADKALFQQGLILSSHLKRPKQALTRFQALLKNYPQSNLADDAMTAIGALHSAAGDYPEALKTYAQTLERFPENRDACAEAQVAIGRIRFHLGEARAADTLLAVLRDYPDKTARCAEAQYLLGRYYQEIHRNPDRAVKAYQAVIDAYTDSQYAEPSRQAIGLIYYQRKTEEEKQGKKVFLDTPVLVAASDENFFPLIASLQICTSRRGVRATSAQLMGLSGLAFENYYSRDNIADLLALQPDSPLEPVCAAFGLRYEMVVTRDVKEAWAWLRRTLDDGQPAMALIRASPPRWSAIVGYDQKPSQVLVKGQGSGIRRIGVADLDRVLQKPPASMTDSPPPAWARFVFFSMNGAPRTAQRRRAELRSLKTAADLLRGDARGAIPSGLRAFQELQADVDAISSDPASDRKPAVAAWAARYLPRLRSARKSATAYLRSLAKHFNGERAIHIDEAAEALARSEALLDRLQSQLAVEPSPLEGATESSSAERWRQASETIQSIIEQERLAAEAISAASVAAAG